VRARRGGHVEVLIAHVGVRVGVAARVAPRVVIAGAKRRRAHEDHRVARAAALDDVVRIVEAQRALALCSDPDPDARAAGLRLVNVISYEPATAGWDVALDWVSDELPVEAGPLAAWHPRDVRDLRLTRERRAGCGNRDEQRKDGREADVGWELH